MRFDPIWLAALFALALVAFAGWVFWRQRELERQRWTRYNRPRGAGPQSWVCPTCLTRYHGERAIREKRCRTCDEGADQPA